jgi:hypothetical protein
MSHLDTPPPDTAAAQRPAAAAVGTAGGSPRRRGLSLAAFVVGLGSLLLGAAPVIAVVPVVGGVVAVLLAVVALRPDGPGRTGTGFAVSGIALGGLAVVVAVLVWVGTAAAVRAIERAELDAVPENAAAARTSAVVDQAAVQDAVVTDEPARVHQDADPVVAGGRRDFSGISCEVLGAEAVLLSRQLTGDDPALLAIRDPVAVADHRSDHAPPVGAEESLVLACRGTATWADSTTSPVLTELTVDAGGDLVVGYAGE